MSVRDKPCSQDACLQEVFGAPVAELYQAAGNGTCAALALALELRSFLAVVEEQIVRIRDRVHAVTGPTGEMDELSAQQLRDEAQLLEAFLSARDSYRAVLGDLLRAAPSHQLPARPTQVGDRAVTTTLPAGGAVPAPAPAGTPRAPSIRP
ncbi:hypothetical protein [Streptomyces sp. NPDC001508]|uniref:hypothetical protein n=1 Tax=Streptomyces sp. NPDC001508 TaxID=3154656 RepID=UPI0033348244